MGGIVRTEVSGAVGTILFDHPERRNAISSEMWRAIPQAASELTQNDAVRVVVLRGAGEEAFVSGADISEFETLRTGANNDFYNAENGRAFAALAEIPKPVIALIHGFCVGGGVAISLSADIRYAADDAVFAVPAARLGLGYHMGGLRALRDVVGASTAKEIFFTARRYSAEEALQIRLVNQVLPKAELDAFVAETCARIADNAPLTLRSVKRIAHELSLDPEQRDAAAVAASIETCFESEDYREGVRAFLEKRRPVFRGR